MKPMNEARLKRQKGSSRKPEKSMIVLRGGGVVRSLMKAQGIERVASAMKPIVRVAQP